MIYISLESLFHMQEPLRFLFFVVLCVCGLYQPICIQNLCTIVY